MIIRVNGQTMDASGITGENLEEILLDIQASMVNPDDLIVEVLVNGDLYQEDVPHAAMEVPREGIDTLDINTRSPEELARHFLEHGPQMIESMILAMPKITEMFRLGDETEANEHYLQFLESLHLLVTMLDNVGKVLDLEYEVQEDGGPSLNALLDKIARHLSEMLDIQEQSDWIYLADLLEYELTPALEGLRDILPHLNQRIH